VNPIDTARGIIERAIADRIFPGANVDAGSSAGSIWSEAFGALTFEEGSPSTQNATTFDLASLTKPVATATILMELTRTGRVGLDDPVSRFFGDWKGVDRERVTIGDLLEHASGLPARLVDTPSNGRREFEHEIGRMPLESAPRAKAIYSDLGFILLGFLAADVGGASLAELLDRLMIPLDTDVTYDLGSERKQLAAPTLPLAEDARRGRTLRGEVHDNYAAALGGAAGHAGLFGTARDVGIFARAMLRTARGASDCPPPFNPEIVASFTLRSRVPGSSRALGWDTMLPTSSCGTRMSRSAFGHVGFTGTSLWIDPARDRYFVLLTNRACGGGSLDEMREVRRSFHDALAAF
jgi:serine-type D-Ala-D-Ala carboxypeptidase